MIDNQSHVTPFRIWRLAESVGWNCTVREVADELGVSPRLVRHWAKVRGWNFTPSDPNKNLADAIPVDAPQDHYHSDFFRGAPS